VTRAVLTGATTNELPSTGTRTAARSEPIRGDVDIAPIGALLGDPTRAQVLMALADGRALPASRLASEAGVAPSTVSEHLARLLAAGLVTVRPEGRSKFYRLASPEVADALEAIARIAPERPVRSLREGSHAHALREARTCYNHLAGRLGVGLFAGLLSHGLLSGGDGQHHPDQAVHDRLSAPGRDLSYRLTPRGEEALGAIGMDLDAVLARRPAVRYCLDWSEQQHHLAGPLGTALADRLFALGWVTRTQRRRVVRVTEAGREKLPEVLGLASDWDQSALGRAG
jgi:DNA-binding transcriptional ArsR family regulator